MKRGIILIFAFLLIGILSFNSSAQEVDPTVCCEETNSGLFCQDVPQSECQPGARQLPTSCESTSFCKPGVCYDSNEGTCTENTPQLVCNQNDGAWSEASPPQCDLGCCILGDQAAFVTLVRCKRLSASLGLQTNYNNGITSEAECVLTASSQDKGACVFDFEFERTCKYTTRSECDFGVNQTGIQGEFFEGKLCSAEELGTNCGPTTRTTLVPGRDEVYFVDSCGNPANIYDASKINNLNYWSNVQTKLESCSPNRDNANSPTCGNCNYLLGTVGREADSSTVDPRYGDYVCADLNCENTQNGRSYKHGESWCVYEDSGSTDQGENSVGSRFFKHLCINGEEVVEQCADFRQEECIEDKLEVTLGSGTVEFSQAACRVNRWQDCIAQENEEDCENTDRRDCIWKEGLPGEPLLFLDGAPLGGACLPKNSPGLRFWQGEEALNVCSQANAKCIVTKEKDLFGGEKCVENCHCLEDEWGEQRIDICINLGDCGPNENWIGQEGYKKSYEITLGKA